MGVDADPTVATEQILEALTAHRVAHGLPRPGRRPVLHLQRRAGPGRRGGAGGREAAATPAATISNAMHVRRRSLQVLPLRPAAPPTDAWSCPAAIRIDGAHLVFVSNVDPWTYLGNTPIRTNPGTSPTTGLGVFAADQHGVPAGPAGRRRRSSAAGPAARPKHIVRADDEAWATVRCTRARRLADGWRLPGRKDRSQVHLCPEGASVSSVMPTCGPTMRRASSSPILV